MDGFDFEPNENVLPNDNGMNLEIDVNENDNKLDNGGLGEGSMIDIGDGDIMLDDGNNFGNIEDDDQLPGVDDLPLFAGPEARKVHLQIKDHEIALDDNKNSFLVDLAYQDLNKKELIAKDISMNVKLKEASENEPRS